MRQNIHLIFQNAKTFWWVYIPFLLICVSLVSLYSREELHVLCNEYHSPFWDQFFAYATYLGEGWFVLPFCIIGLFTKNRVWMFWLLSFLIILIVVLTLKRVVFPDILRPSAVFKEGSLHLVDGVTLRGRNSFPSGHASSAFLLGFGLCLWFKNRFLQISFAVIAILIAYSRVYLSQHFVVDIMVGSFIAVLISWLTQAWLQTRNWPWLDKSVFSFR